MVSSEFVLIKVLIIKSIWPNCYDTLLIHYNSCQERLEINRKYVKQNYKSGLSSTLQGSHILPSMQIHMTKLRLEEQIVWSLLKALRISIKIILAHKEPDKDAVIKVCWIDVIRKHD